MKLFKIGLAATLLSLSSVASAGWVDTIYDVKHMQAPDSITKTHDITNDGFVPGFWGLPGNIVNKATLSIWVTDDVDYVRCFVIFTCPDLRDTVKESAAVSWLNVDLGQFEVDLLDTHTFTFNLFGGLLDAAVLLDIWADGRMSYTLRAVEGDFYFLGSQLAVNVPEPASLALLGLGLLGMGFARRRKTA